MNNLRKMGGITALVHAAAYLIGIVMYFAVLSPVIDAAPDQYLAQLAEYKDMMYLWILIAYWLSGFCLIVVALALYDRLKESAPAVMQLSAVLAFIWAGLIIGSGNLMMHSFYQLADLYAANPAQAETVSLALGITENGIVSANELIGGLWILLTSWVALQSGAFTKGLNYLGLLIGLSGILTMIPPLAEATQTAFGLLMIVWFSWAGIVLLRGRSTTAPESQPILTPTPTN